MTDTKLNILNSKGKFVASYSRENAKPNTTLSATWDGKATAGNNAGLAKGKRVAKGTYSVAVYAGQTTLKSNTMKIKIVY